MSIECLMHEAGHSKTVLRDSPEGWDGEGRGRGVQDGGTPVADSCGCMAKTTTNTVKSLAFS